MHNFYFVYKKNHKNYGGWIRVISYNWKDAMKEYEWHFGRDYLNFFEESLFQKQACPRGELQIL